jgi:hypothetical protein
VRDEGARSIVLAETLTVPISCNEPTVSEISMIRHIKTFFYPETTVYVYSSQKDELVGQIEKVLNRKYKLFDEKDLLGRFIDPVTFEIETRQFALVSGKMGVKVIGKISDLGNGRSQVRMKASPSYGYYLWFFVAIILGFAYLYKFFQSGQFEFLFLSLGALIIGPVLCIGISRVAIAATYLRYVLYIHKRLIADNIPRSV